MSFSFFPLWACLRQLFYSFRPQVQWVFFLRDNLCTLFSSSEWAYLFACLVILLLLWKLDLFQSEKLGISFSLCRWAPWWERVPLIKRVCSELWGQPAGKACGHLRPFLAHFSLGPVCVLFLLYKQLLLNVVISQRVLHQLLGVLDDLLYSCTCNVFSAAPLKLSWAGSTASWAFPRLRS